jgi:hypothetical protein
MSELWLYVAISSEFESVVVAPSKQLSQRGIRKISVRRIPPGTGDT